MYKFNFKGLDIVVISDTHGEHNKVKIPICDLLIHLGDICNFGNKKEITNFVNWFKEQPATTKILVAGNHDTCFEAEFDAFVMMIPEQICLLDNCKTVLSGANGEEICIASVPVRFGDVGTEWIDLDNVDILLTHAPPLAVFDEGYGSRRLLNLFGEYQPSYHLFGHVHRDAPCVGRCGKTTFVNVTQKY